MRQSYPTRGLPNMLFLSTCEYYFYSLSKLMEITLHEYGIIKSQKYFGHRVLSFTFRELKPRTSPRTN